MINKKILAASIAAAFTFNANAVISLNDATTSLDYATQSVSSGGTIASSSGYDLSVKAGLNLPAGTNFYVRIELGNAKLVTSAPSALTDSNGGTLTSAIAGGGTANDSYVVYTYSSSTAVPSATVLSLGLGTATGLIVTSNAAPVTATYKLYQDSASLAALNGGSGEVTSTSATIIDLVNGQDVAKTFVSNANTALVATQFTTFKADTAPAVIATGKVASLGTVDLTFKATTLDASSSQVDEADVFTTPATTATVTGDFSFGKTWHMSALQTCATAASATNTLVIAADKASATVPSLDYTAGQTLCVAVDGTEIIPRNTAGYDFALAANAGVAGSLGSITYDTTAITVPYLTTFSGYNQRVYILNNSSVVAPYSTTFQTEAGVTATAGTMATGSVPAKTMIAIKATDLVTFSGGTRGAAVIEIEATSGNVESTSQSVNKSDGGTDTTVLKVQ
jgi:hypothetical protein